MILKITDAKGTLMESIRGSLSMELEKVMEHFNGTTDRFLKDNGKMEQKMDLVFGNLQKEIFMREIGCLTDNMEKVYISIGSVLIKENLLNFSSKVKGNKYFQMETSMLGLISKVSLMEKENMNGQTEVIMKEILLMVWGMEWENGYLIMVLSMKDLLKTILRKGKVDKNTSQVKYMLAHLKKEINMLVLFMIKIKMQ